MGSTTIAPICFNLRLLRNARGITQEMLAIKLTAMTAMKPLAQQVVVTRSNVDSWEAGAEPRASAALLIAQQFNVGIQILTSELLDQKSAEQYIAAIKAKELSAAPKEGVNDSKKSLHIVMLEEKINLLENTILDKAKLIASLEEILTSVRQRNENLERLVAVNKKKPKVKS